MKKVFFVTTNFGKVKEARALLAPYGIRVEPKKAELDEPRTRDMKRIALEKARQALALCRAPVVVEDTGIFFEACDEFPGAFSKLFVTSVGIAGVLRLLNGAGVSRKAFFQTVVGYASPKQKPVAFIGRCYGKITKKPRGTPHHERLPYDSVFVPKGESRTFAEMTHGEKARFSHRAKAFRRFGEWFAEQ